MLTFIEGERSKRMEKLTLQILTEAMQHVNPAWKTSYRDDDENYLELGVADADGNKMPIARIYIVAVDMTGGEIARAGDDLDAAPAQDTGERGG